MKNKLILTGLFLFHATTPIAASDPLSSFSNIAQTSVATDLGASILTRSNKDELEKALIQLGISIITIAIIKLCKLKCSQETHFITFINQDN